MAPEYKLLQPSAAADPVITEEHEEPRSVLHGIWSSLQSARRSAWENGIICASIACVIFSFSSLQVKLTGGRVPVLQLCIIRSSISFCTSVLSGRATGIKPLFGHRQHFPLLFTRGFFGTLAISLSYFALMMLPLGDAVTLSRLRPPATAVMARVLLGEPLGIQGALGCLISVGGVIILAQPPFLMGGHSNWSHKRLVGTLCGVSSTLFACGTSYAVRKIGKREPALTVALWYHTTTISLMIWPLLAGIPEAAKLVAWRDCLLLLGIATTSFFAQLLMTRSFQLIPAAKAASVGFMGVIYSHILGALIFDEKITSATVLGAGLIFVGVVLVTLRKDSDSPDGSSSKGDGSGNNGGSSSKAEEAVQLSVAAIALVEGPTSGLQQSQQSQQQQQQHDALMVITSEHDDSKGDAATSTIQQEDRLPLLQQASVVQLQGTTAAVDRPAWLQQLLWGRRQQENSDGSSTVVG